MQRRDGPVAKGACPLARRSAVDEPDARKPCPPTEGIAHVRLGPRADVDAGIRQFCSEPVNRIYAQVVLVEPRGRQTSICQGPGEPPTFAVLPPRPDRLRVPSPRNHPLRKRSLPDWSSGNGSVRVVDLFSGIGGLSLGVAQAARARRLAVDVALAVDMDPKALRVFEQTFPGSVTRAEPIEEVLPGRFGERSSLRERELAREVRDVHVLVGGPPCQGHSSLNNHTRMQDPRNAFYERMARAAELFEPAVVLVENVPTVQRDRGRVAQRTAEALGRLGYDVANQVVSLSDLGVAQKRRRHVLLAVAPGVASPTEVMAGLAKCVSRDVGWAIGDLVDVAEPSASSPLDRPSRLSLFNQKRIRYLVTQDLYDLPNDLRPRCHQSDSHSYKSMYGRLRWSEPAQTITSGFSSPGQGRYVHPSEPRTLTPREAARLQGLPDYCPLDAVPGRGALAQMIGNAVPPALSRLVVGPLLRDIVASPQPLRQRTIGSGAAFDDLDLASVG